MTEGSRATASPDLVSGAERGSRRRFLAGAGAIAAGALVPRPAIPVRAAAAETPKLPQVPFGPHSMSRLICGANPFSAGSHLSVFVNEEMRRYYTEEQILKTLRRCEEVGINFWQAHGDHHKLYRRFREKGGTLKYLSLGCGSPGDPPIKAMAEAGCVAIAHHGEVTDGCFKSGEIEKVHEYLKRVRDAGLLAGVSTHMPAVVHEVESRGWDIDFYMTCVYERHRSAADLEKLLGQAPIPVGEVYLPKDPPRMFEAIRGTKRPCLAFKILAAGRLSERKEWVEAAFRQTFESIKPDDAVIVGIYDRYSDQPAECAELARRYGMPPPGSART